MRDMLKSMLTVRRSYILVVSDFEISFFESHFMHTIPISENSSLEIVDLEILKSEGYLYS